MWTRCSLRTRNQRDGYSQLRVCSPTLQENPLPQQCEVFRFTPKRLIGPLAQDGAGRMGVRAANGIDTRADAWGILAVPRWEESRRSPTAVCHLVGMSCWDLSRQRDAVAIGGDVVSRFGLAAIQRIGAGLINPKRPLSSPNRPPRETIRSCWLHAGGFIVRNRSGSTYLKLLQSRYPTPAGHPVAA